MISIFARFIRTRSVTPLGLAVHTNPDDLAKKPWDFPVVNGKALFLHRQIIKSSST